MQLPKRQNRRAISCTECRRRKQKCVPNKYGPCANCSRRYPPVECVLSAWVRAGLPSPRPGFREFVSSPGPSVSDGRPNLGPIDTTNYKPIRPLILKKSSYEPNDYQINIIPRTDSDLRHNYEAELENEEPQIPESCIPPLIDLDFDPSLIDPQLLDDIDNIPEIQRPIGGILTSISNTTGISVPASSLNTELFYFFHQAVAPFMFSLTPQGQDTPPGFQEQVVPWITECPIMPQLAVFTALGYRAHTSGIEMTEHRPTMAAKGQVLATINSFLKEDFDKIHVFVIQAILHLALMEWYCYDVASLWAHMRGLREMIRLRGGTSKLESPFLRQLLLLTDYEFACDFETDLFLVQPQDFADTLPASYPETYSSPLVDSSITFRSINENIGISAAAASILDDMRSLTLSILLLSSSEKNISRTEEESHAKLIQITASQIHEELNTISFPSTAPQKPKDAIFSVIHLTALAYTSSISSRTPFSVSYDGSARTTRERREINYAINKVGLRNWRKIPGIFLWVLLVACPGGRAHAPMLLRSNISATASYLSFADLGLAVGCLRAFLGVQKWIADVPDKRGLDKGTGEDEVDG